MSNLFGLGPRVRHGYGVWFDMVMAKAKPGWSGPGQVLVRTWSGPCSNLVWVRVRHGYDKAIGLGLGLGLVRELVITFPTNHLIFFYSVFLHSVA